MTLTEKWETCSTCEGDGIYEFGAPGVGNYDATFGINLAGEESRCPDCVDGLVPPRGMVREAVVAFVDCLEGADSYSVGEFISMERALVAAKRWEKE